MAALDQCSTTQAAHKYDTAPVSGAVWFQRTLRQAMLSETAKVGLEYVEDLLHRIPRAEVERIAAVVVAAAQRIAPGCTAEACGSYRRGAATSGADTLLAPACSPAALDAWLALSRFPPRASE